MHIKIKMALLLAGVATLSSTLVSAQSETGGPAMRTERLRILDVERLRILDARIVTVEQGFNEATKATVPPEGNAASEKFEGQQLAYTIALYEEYTNVLQRADLAARSGGRQGSIEAVNAFEKVAKSHENRLRILDARSQRIIENRGAPTAWVPPMGARVAWIDGFMDSVMSVLVTPAHAMIALNVYNVCNGNAQSPGCLAAIAKGVVDGKAAKATFDTCWANAAKPLKALKRTACTVAFAARLA